MPTPTSQAEAAPEVLSRARAARKELIDAYDGAVGADPADTDREAAELRLTATKLEYEIKVREVTVGTFAHRLEHMPRRALAEYRSTNELGRQLRWTKRKLASRVEQLHARGEHGLPQFRRVVPPEPSLVRLIASERARATANRARLVNEQRDAQDAAEAKTARVKDGLVYRNLPGMKLKMRWLLYRTAAEDRHVTELSGRVELNESYESDLKRLESRAVTLAEKDSQFMSSPVGKQLLSADSAATAALHGQSVNRSEIGRARSVSG